MIFGKSTCSSIWKIKNFNLVRTSCLNAFLISLLQFAALGAICNVSVNFTTRKSSFFQYGGVSQLIQLSKSMDSILRLKSVSALRNLIFLLDRKDKDNILIELSVPMLMSLICGKFWYFHHKLYKDLLHYLIFNMHG